MAQKDIFEKKSVSPIKIFTAINNHDYENLQVFMNNTDWYSIAPQLIIPRDKIRTLVRLIKDEEVRLDVMRYLDKYALDYFKPAAEKLAPETTATPIFTDTELERQTMYLMDEFRKELRFQIDLIESTGKFSGEKYHLQDKKIKDLEKQVKELQETNLQLKTRIDELEHPERKHQVPNDLRCEEFYHIISYLEKYGYVIHRESTIGMYRGPIYYHWNIPSPKALFGYFVCKTCYLLELRTKEDHLMWKLFKQAFDNFDTFEKQARDHASKNKNWENVASSVKPDGAHIIDEAFAYCAKQMERSKALKNE